METTEFNIQLRVLVCKEDGEFVARALEMDLLGYGKTETEALDELKQAMQAQISFAHQKNDYSLLSFPAEAEYFTRWEEAQRKTIHSLVLGDKSGTLKAKATFISFTQQEIKELQEKQSNQFSKKEMVCA